MRELEQLLKALANKRRLTILRLLQRNSRMNVTDIARGLKLSFRATSQHVIILYKAGLLDREQVSLEVHYSLAKDLPRVARDVLQEL